MSIDGYCQRYNRPYCQYKNGKPLLHWQLNCKLISDNKERAEVLASLVKQIFCNYSDIKGALGLGFRMQILPTFWMYGEYDVIFNVFNVFKITHNS